MRNRQILAIAGFVLATLIGAAPASAQVTPCSSIEPTPAILPPADSPPLVRCLEPRFHPENNPSIDWDTYYYHMKTRPSQMSQRKWVPFNEEVLVKDDFWALWRTNFLDNLWIETIDEPYPNGVMGKHIIIHLEERARVKIVDFNPSGSSKQVDVSKIEDALREKGIQVRLDSFVDESTIRKVKGVIQQMYAEKGYQFAEVTPQMTPLGVKLVHLSFFVKQGPKVEIQQVVIDGNKAITDGSLIGAMKENKPRGFLAFILGGGTYQEAKFVDDARNITDYYRERGYARAVVGAPQIEVIGDSKDGKKRYVRLRIPVDEGMRYRVGTFGIAGNTTVKSEPLQKLFKVKEGEYYNEKAIRKGMEKITEVYSAGGFLDLVPEPDLAFRGIDPQTGQPIGPDPPPAIVDVTMRIVEGKQYFLNRLTFLGNNTTHDAVIRREMRVLEGGIFNMEALKLSVRRLNQLGYFKPLEGKEGEVKIDKTANAEGKVDVTLKFEEQNRNQLAFGAGVSQFDGFFGQLSFQTANFLGRGETLGVSAQKGSQARNYQISFSEPFLFDRPITAGIDAYSRQYIYPLQYTQVTTGGNLVVGLPVSDFTRFFVGYNYEEVRVKDINPGFLDPRVLLASPYLVDALLLRNNGRRIVSKISPSFVYNTINAPIFPDEGTRLTASIDAAGLGGNTFYVMNRLEAIHYFKLNSRNSIGVRGQTEYIRPYGKTTTLPIFEKFFLGGEYTVRGFDIRSIGPRDAASGLVVGGNKTVLFNAEYIVNVGGPVRVLAFYDAGQVKDLGQQFTWMVPVTQLQGPDQPVLSDPLTQTNILTPVGALKNVTIGRKSAFNTSTGLEVRFFMPVLNVPFRLIMAYNPQRLGVLNNSLVQTPKFTFRFAVGTTF